MLIHFVNSILFSVLFANLVESKPSCQKCLADSLNYIDHYKYLDCKPVANKDCSQCIDRFECSSLPLEIKKLDAKKCHIANLTYSVGQAILFKRKFCKYCTCVDVPLAQPENNAETNAAEGGDNSDGDDGENNEEENTSAGPIVDFNATALLANRRDPPKYNPMPLDTNYEARVTCTTSATTFNTMENAPNSKEYCFYKENECSGIKHCISKEKHEKENCLYKGKKYAYGELVYPEEEDRCLKCKCSSSWTNNINQMVKQCERLSCDLEDSMLNQGCIPIYENKCCPNNYHCQEDKPKNPEPVETGKCYFNGKNYDVGSKLNTDNPCLDCTCKVPPYHTCIIKENCGE